MFPLEDLAEFLEVEEQDLNATRVRILSSKAAALIRQYAPWLPELVEHWPQDVRDLGLTVVARAIEQAGNAGVDSVSVTAGPFSQTRNYSSDSGTVWLTKQEKEFLRGDGGTRAYGVDLTPRATVVGRRWLTPTWWEPIYE